MAESFKFDLVSPEKLLLSEDVEQVTVPGTEGDFAVMAKHAPFMTTVRPGVVTAKLAGGSEQKIFVRGGFADVAEGGLTLLAEHATPLDEFDAASLDADISTAEEALSKAEDDDLRFEQEQTLAHLRDARTQLGR